jgi:hypothetical protein
MITPVKNGCGIAAVFYGFGITEQGNANTILSAYIRAQRF